MDTQSTSTIQKSKDNLAICYLRVSTEEQKKEGNSITSQRKAAKKYAEENNLDIVEFVEEAKSASKIPDANFDITGNIVEAISHRKKLQEIIRKLQHTKIKHLIVYDRDRLVRNLEMFVALNFFFKKHKIIVHYSKTNEAMDEKAKKVNRFIELVLGSVAELEANLISVRVKEGQQQAVESNKWPGGRTPFGYIDNIKDEGRLLVPSVLQAEDVRKIFYLYNNYGYSYEMIASMLNHRYKDGIWTKGKIESIITNEIYTDHIIRNRRSRNRHPELDPSIVKSDAIKGADIINEETWDRAQKIRTVKSATKDAKYYNTPYILRGKLICGLCNNYMKTKSHGKDKHGNKRDGIYRCALKKNNSRVSELILNKSEIEAVFINEITTLLKFKKLDKFWDYYNSRVSKEKSHNNKSTARLTEEITNKESRLSKIKELLDEEPYLDDNTSEDDVEAIRVALESEETMIIKEIKALKKLKSKIIKLNNSYFNNIEELRSSLGRFFTIDFCSLDNERKRVMIDILVHKVIITPTDEGLDMKIILKSNFDVL